MIRNLAYYRRTLGWSGVASACRAKLAGSPVLHELTTRDLRSPLWLRVPSADVKVYDKVFLADEYLFDTRSPPATIIDAGAHIGLATIKFAHRFPEARIIAVEPERRNFELLSRNVAAYKRVTPVHAALWGEACELDMVDPGGGSWGFIASRKEDPRGPGMSFSHTVRGVTVSQLMDDFGLDRIDILKLDIEGSERALFLNAVPWLKAVGGLIIELHEHLQPGCKQAFYGSTDGFGVEWTRGENVFLSRPRGVMVKPQEPGF